MIAAVEGHGFASIPTDGLSGGQKRKLSMAIQLLSEKTRFLFLDEPTSGLDGTSTLSLLTLLSSLGKNGYTILITIHQPRIEVWELFDEVLILAAGRTCYQGPPKTAVPFLSAAVRQNSGGAFAQPKGSNPADVVLDFLREPANQKLVSTAHASTREVRESRREIDEFGLALRKVCLGSIELSVGLESNSKAPQKRHPRFSMASMLYMPPIPSGEPTTMLQVTLVRGSGLPAKNIGGTSDPHVCAYIMEQTGNVQKSVSKTKMRTLCPDFESEVLTWVVDDAHQTRQHNLVIEVWDWNRWHADSFIGMVRFPIRAAVEASAETPIVAWKARRVESRSGHSPTSPRASATAVDTASTPPGEEC